MEPILNDMVALITGAGSGIGQACAVGFAELGAKLIVTGRTLEKLETTKKAIEAAGGECLIATGDVQNYEEVEAVVKQGLDKFGKIDILINNAGVSRIKKMARIKIETADMILKTNILGPYYFTHAVIPTMIEQGGGTILNTGSLVIKNAMAGWVAYGMSKSALVGFTEHLGAELKPKKININTLHPMMVDTPLLRLGLSDADVERLNPWSAKDLIPYFAFFGTKKGRKVTGLNVDMEIVRTVLALKDKLPADQQAEASWKLLSEMADKELRKDEYKHAKKCRKLIDFLLPNL